MVLLLSHRLLSIPKRLLVVKRESVYGFIMKEPTKGILALVLACIIWGLSGLYYKLLSHIPPLEVLSHRTVWSMVFFGTVIIIQGRLSDVGQIFRDRRTLGVLAVTAVMISINWFGFIFSIQIGWAVEASLGYYIFPLVAVVLGYVFLGERFHAAQIVAIIMAVIAVLTLSFGLGETPWISLILGTTFGLYGLLKQRVKPGAVLSVFVEVLLIAPLAAIWLFGVHKLDWVGVGDGGAVFGTNYRLSLILMFSGVLTAGPLILFSYASKRLKLSTVGLIQYLNPTLQFTVAVVVFNEAFTQWHAIAFPLIWVGLGIYSVQSWRQEKSMRNNLTTTSK